MGKQRTQRPRYMVFVIESAKQPGTLAFTFVAKADDADGNRPLNPAAQFIADIDCAGEQPIRWRSPPADVSEKARLESEIRERLKDRNIWIRRVNDLVDRVQQWGKELGWSMRRVDRRLEDSRIGKHRVPALLLQQDTVRLLLEPVSRVVPGGEGLVELSIMPTYDDVASLYFRDNRWYVHYVFPRERVVADVQEAEARPLSKKVLALVLEKMKSDVA